MTKLLIPLLAAIALFAADDPWAKVKDLKSGTELRVYKRGGTQPVLVKMGELTDDNLIVVEKNAETAIPRDQIDRIDYRPTGKPRWSTENRVGTKDGTGDPKAVIPRPNSGGASNVPSNESSSAVAVGSRPDFEMIYRRPTGGPKASAK